jgi:hypothetical protein
LRLDSISQRQKQTETNVYGTELRSDGSLQIVGQSNNLLAFWPEHTDVA